MASLQPAWAFVVANIIKSAASYFLKCRGSTGRGVLICAMMLACAFGMVQMIHQVVFTAMFVQLLRSAGTVEAIGTLQHIQVAFLHLAQVQVFGIIAVAINTSQPTFSRIDTVIVVSVGLAITNLLLTGLKAGRIWWTRHHLFESSLLYFVIFLVYLLIDILGSPATFESPVIALLSGAATQLMNIMPALVIVRVSLARSVDTDPTAGNLKVESSVY
ncbi:hypothetical protein B0H13DRAFT_1923759 [Mycena leptocephala]|nr:hypothetical protein B0H13DRAFT_1923759 [Mycena leptocephala]